MTWVHLKKRNEIKWKTRPINGQWGMAINFEYILPLKLRLKWQRKAWLRLWSKKHRDGLDHCLYLAVKQPTHAKSFSLIPNAYKSIKSPKLNISMHVVLLSLVQKLTFLKVFYTGPRCDDLNCQNSTIINSFWEDLSSIIF